MTPFSIQSLPAGVTPLGVGLHDGIPGDVYHADPCIEPSLSSGVLRTILAKSIEHAALEHRRLGGGSRDATKFMDFGSVVHALLAGKNSDLVLGDFDSFRSKAAQEWKRSVDAVGKTPALNRDMDAARPVVEAIRTKAALGITNDPFAPHGRSEVTAIWREGDAWCRARYDRLVIDPEGYADVWDWKTTSDISDRGIEKAVSGLGYHIQAGFYLRGLEALRPTHRGRCSFILCFVETSAPYHVRRVTLSPTYLAIGRRKVEEGIARWKEAMGAQNFSALPFPTLEVEAPAYMDEDDQISASSEVAA